MKDLLFEIDYPAVMKKDFFQEGIQKLIAESKDKVVAIMCAEEDPANCHRHHLIGRYLSGQGLEVLHIRGDGTVQKDEHLPDEPGRKR